MYKDEYVTIQMDEIIILGGDSVHLTPKYPNFVVWQHSDFG